MGLRNTTLRRILMPWTFVRCLFFFFSFFFLSFFICEVFFCISFLKCEAHAWLLCSTGPSSAVPAHSLSKSNVSLKCCILPEPCVLQRWCLFHRMFFRAGTAAVWGSATLGIHPWAALVIRVFNHHLNTQFDPTGAPTASSASGYNLVAISRFRSERHTWVLTSCDL